MITTDDVKVRYITDGKRFQCEMGCPSGSAVFCTDKIDKVSTIAGKTAVTCLEDGSIFLCQIQQGSSPLTYDLSVCDEVVVKNAAIVWAEVVTATLYKGEWERIAKEDPSRYYRWTASHPIPILRFGKGGRATIEAGADV